MWRDHPRSIGWADYASGEIGRALQKALQIKEGQWKHVIFDTSFYFTKLIYMRGKWKCFLFLGKISSWLIVELDFCVAYNLILYALLLQRLLQGGKWKRRGWCRERSKEAFLSDIFRNQFRKKYYKLFTAENKFW